MLYRWGRNTQVHKNHIPKSVRDDVSRPLKLGTHSGFVSTNSTGYVLSSEFSQSRTGFPGLGVPCSCKTMWARYLRNWKDWKDTIAEVIQSHCFTFPEPEAHTGFVDCASSHGDLKSWGLSLSTSSPHSVWTPVGVGSGNPKIQRSHMNRKLWLNTI